MFGSGGGRATEGVMGDICGVVGGRLTASVVVVGGVVNGWVRGGCC